MTLARSSQVERVTGRRLAASPLLLVAALLFVRADPVVGAEESAWQALRTPGAVVVLRHSFAPGGFDPPDARLDDCSTQRNLDANGRAQAQRIGEAFRRQHGITVETVLSSPLPVPRHRPAGLREGAVVGASQGIVERRGAFAAARS
jgi:hypothetical protein